jgi:hypothetical protein
MSLTPTQLLELQTIVLDLGEEFPHNADALWNAAIRIQTGGLGPTSGAGGQPAFDAAVADIKVCQEEVQTYQQRQGSPNSGFDVAVLQVVPATSTFPTGNVGEILYLETAPNSFIATDQIVIDPVGPNSVQMDEVGTTVFRTVPPASGGIEINNLSTGAGFERVLTTSDLGGGVASVTGGININLTGTGVDPVVNLDAAITGVSVNGVTLSNAGAATDYLDETGAYSTPAIGGQVDSVVGGVSISVNSADPINPIVDFDGAITVIINADINTATPPTTESVNCRLDFEDLAGDDSLGFVGYNAGNDLQVQNRMQSGEVILRGEDLAGVQRLGARFNFDAGGESYIAGFTTVAMRFMTGVEYAVLATLNAGVDLRHDNTDMARTVAIGSGGFEVNNTVTGAGFERVLTTSDSGGGVAGLTTEIQFNNAGSFGASAAFTWDDVNATLTIDASPGSGPALQIDNIDPSGTVIQMGGIGSGSTNWAIFRSFDNSGSFSWALIDDHGLSSANHRLYFQNQSGQRFIEMDNSNEIRIMGSESVEQIYINNSGTVAIRNNATLYLEQTAVNANITGHGQLFVEAADDSLHYVTEAGVDFDLTAGLTQPITLTADIDGDGFNLDDMGVMFMREQAASDPDIPTQGQIWMRDDSFANTLMFTTGQGNEFEVSGLPYNGDVLNGSLSLSSTTFGGAANIGPKPDHFYMIICRGQITTPDATDDGKVQLSVDTLSLFQGLYTDSNGQSVSMQSATGEVVTNTVVVDTDGSGVDDGTYFQIIGTLRSGANAQTVSLRVAKNANNGGNGLCSFPSISVIQLTE